MNKKRYTVVDFPNVGDRYGIFESTTPSGSASKALTKLSRMANISNDNNKFIIFVMENIDTGKQTRYIGTRVKLANPTKVNNRIYKYRNILTRFDEEYFDVNNLQ